MTHRSVENQSRSNFVIDTIMSSNNTYVQCVLHFDLMPKVSFSLMDDITSMSLEGTLMALAHSLDSD